MEGFLNITKSLNLNEKYNYLENVDSLPVGSLKPGLGT
jgi:hypothetical protein